MKNGTAKCQSTAFPASRESKKGGSPAKAGLFLNGDIIKLYAIPHERAEPINRHHNEQ